MTSNWYRVILVVICFCIVMVKSKKITCSTRSGTVACVVVPERKELDCINKDLRKAPNCNQPNIEFLNLRKNYIETFRDDISRYNDTLKRLSLENNELTDIPRLGRFPKLEELELHINQITSIHEGAFQEMKQLKCINLASNRLANIEPLTFQNLRRLRVVILGNNSLSSLPANCFESTDLRKLDLSRNKLSYVNPDIFKGLEDLESLDLRFNNLKQFPVDAFIILISLERFNLSQNPIDCNCHSETVALSSWFYVKQLWTPSACDNGVEFVNLYKDCDAPEFEKSSRLFGIVPIPIGIVIIGGVILILNLITCLCCKCNKRRRIKRMFPSEIRRRQSYKCCQVEPYRMELADFPHCSFPQHRMSRFVPRDILARRSERLPSIEPGVSREALLSSVDTRGYLRMARSNSRRHEISLPRRGMIGNTYCSCGCTFYIPTPCQNRTTPHRNENDFTYVDQCVYVPEISSESRSIRSNSVLAPRHVVVRLSGDEQHYDEGNRFLEARSRGERQRSIHYHGTRMSHRPIIRSVSNRQRCTEAEVSTGRVSHYENEADVWDEEESNPAIIYQNIIQTQAFEQSEFSTIGLYMNDI